MSANAADSTLALSIYRADGDALFQGGASPVSDGYAVVHEQRNVQLAGNRDTVVIDGLPATLDAEAVAVDFGAGVKLLAQRVLASGDAGILAAHRGEKISVRSAANQVLASGVLVGTDDTNLIVDDSTQGKIVYVHDYASLTFLDSRGLPGSTLQLTLAGSAGTHAGSLTYPTSGIGWRAAYSALLLGDTGCRLRLDALASIANRSGRDYPAAQLKLVAGAPNFGRSPAPRGMMFKTMAAEAAPTELPEQTSLGDYRSYMIDGTLDLPDASVTQVPLYAPRELACERSWVYDTGNSWFAAKPQLTAGADSDFGGPIQSRLRFVAAENLPAGNLRVLTRGVGGTLEFLGQSRVDDTSKGQPVDIVLGNAFDLNAKHERTAFSVDRAAREMDEGFRISLGNAGEVARTVTVRAHPNRWRNWKLANSSLKPSRQTPDFLEFRIDVPAGGQALLDYTVRYNWTAADE